MSKTLSILGTLILFVAPLGAHAWMVQETSPVLEDASSEASELIDPEMIEPPGVVYMFDECVRPAEPVLATEKKSRGRVTRAAENQAVRQYNAHVEDANAYMRCIADEAQRDLDAYYKAVTQALDAEQASVMGDLETMRDGLRARR